MSLLPPYLAAIAAEASYQMLLSSEFSGRDLPGLEVLESQFDLGSASRFMGTTGYHFIRLDSGFGFCAMGLPRTDFEGHLLIATRGTTVGQDWGSNLNVGMAIGPSGHLVHAGFNRTHGSVRDALVTSIGKIREKQQITAVHCVGHSLGGAVATMNAAWAVANKLPHVHCYTFGAPRVGDALFSDWLSSKLSGRLQRVHHSGDPVPMIPLFPFVHAPLGEPGHPILGDWLISTKFHSMNETYIPFAKKFESWDDMAKAPRIRQTDRQIQLWLEKGGLSGGWLMGSAMLLNNIARALRFILDTALVYVGLQFGTKVVVYATALDQIAAVLMAGAAKAIQIKRWVERLIEAIWAFLGRPPPTVEGLTTAFLRYVLDLLFTTIATAARRAMGQLP
jgi:triacylglycerol lipase